MASAAVEPAAAVEATSTVEPAASSEVTAAVKAAPAKAAIESTPVISASTVVAATIIAASVKAAAIEAVSVIAAIPGAGADEDAANKPVRAVVAVGGACVRIVVVIAIGAHRGRAIVGGAVSVIDGAAKARTEGDVLGVGIGRGEHANGEQDGEQAENLKVSEL